MLETIFKAPQAIRKTTQEINRNEITTTRQRTQKKYLKKIKEHAGI